jgi:hypothetical protein
MWKLVLDDDELRALHALLTETTRQPSPFPLSPTRQVYRSILMKLRTAQPEASQPSPNASHRR